MTISKYIQLLQKEQPNSDYWRRQYQNKLKSLELEEGEREAKEQERLVTSLLGLVALRKQCQRFGWLAIVFILIGMPDPVRAEWTIDHNESEDIYSAFSEVVSVEMPTGKDLTATEAKTDVIVAFYCYPSNRAGALAMVFKEGFVFADHFKPVMVAMLGYKVYGKPYKIGEPVRSYKTPVLHPEEEAPQIVFFPSSFRKDFLQYMESTHDDRKHVLALYLGLKHGQKPAFTKNISLANAKVSIRAAQKMCE